MNWIKKLAALLIKAFLVIAVLFALIGIPVLVFSFAWNFLARLYDEHFFWFFLIVAPVLWLAVKSWKWFSELSGVAFLQIGRVIDRLER